MTKLLSDDRGSQRRVSDPHNSSSLHRLPEYCSPRGMSLRQDVLDTHSTPVRSHMSQVVAGTIVPGLIAALDEGGSDVIAVRDHSYPLADPLAHSPAHSYSQVQTYAPRKSLQGRPVSCSRPVSCTCGQGALAVCSTETALAHKTLQLALSGGRSALESAMTRALQSGVSLKDLLLDHMAPAAQLAGEMWYQDRMNFVEVGMAVSTMSSVARTLATMDTASLQAPVVSPAGQPPRCLLMSRESDEHTFGLQIFAALLRSDGWQVTALPRVRTETAVAYLQRDHYHLVGLSVGSAISHSEINHWSRSIRGSVVGGPCDLMLGGSGCAEFCNSIADLDIDYCIQSSLEARTAAQGVMAKTVAWSRTPC